MKFRMLSIFLLLFISNPLSAVDIDNREVINSFEMQYFEDSNNKSTIYEIIKKGNFKPIDNNFNLGTSDSKIWFKLELHNSTFIPQTRTVAANDYTNKVFNYYEVSNNILINTASSGQDTPVNQRAIQDPFPAYKITLIPNQTKTLYIELKSDIGISDIFTIHKQNHYEHMRNLRNYFFIFYFGVVFTIIMYSLIIYLYSRETIYLYYLIYITFHAIWIFFHSGFSAYIVPHEVFNYSFLAIPTTFFMFILFTEKLLHDAVKSSYFNAITKAYKILFAFNVIYMLIDFQNALTLSSILINTLFFFGIFIIKYGNKNTNLYSFALMIYLVLISFPMLILLDVIANNFFTRTANVFGSVVEMILFSVLIANQIKMLKHEKELSDEKLIEQQMQQNDILKTKVDEQTKNLRLLFQELHHRVKNNFQFILTFLWIQKKSILDKDALHALELTTKRIHAISKLHELLYKKNKTSIIFKDYLEEFLLIFSSEHTNVSIISDVKEIELSYDDAVAFGLILNELITNSFKYAFDNVENPKISISFYEQNKKCFLKYKDNGIGFDKTLLSSHNGFGYELIQELTHSLNNAIMMLNSENGVAVEIIFLNRNKS